jgi:hypothetical protein
LVSPEPHALATCTYAWLHGGMMKYNFQLSKMHLAMVHKFKLIFLSIFTALWYISTWLYQNGVSEKTQKRFGTLVIVANVLEGMKLWSMARSGHGVGDCLDYRE